MSPDSSGRGGRIARVRVPSGRDLTLEEARDALCNRLWAGAEGTFVLAVRSPGPGEEAPPEPSALSSLEWLGVLSGPEAERARDPDVSPGSGGPEVLALPPLIGPDGARLTGDGAPTLREFREAGVLPEALGQALALPALPAGADQETMAFEELCAAFDLRRAARAPWVFGEEPLLRLEALWLARFDPGELAVRCRPHLQEQELWSEDLEEGGARRGWFLRVLAVAREGARSLPDVVAGTRAFLCEAISYEAGAFRRCVRTDPVAAVRGLRSAREALARIPPQRWDRETVAEALRTAADRIARRPQDLAGPLGTALTGGGGGSVALEAAFLQGREKALARLETMIAFLDHDPEVQQARRAADRLVPPPR